MDLDLKDAIRRYAWGADQPRRAVEGLASEDLSAFPMPGTWSIQQIVVHLMDSDLVASERMKRVVAEEDPTLVSFNESAFAHNLFYDRLDVRDVVELFRLNRRLTTILLESLPEEAFRRTGHHTERGGITLASLVVGMAEHLDHHLKFLREKRRLLGKPL